MEQIDRARPAINFGRFQVVPARRELIADGAPVELGSRAFEVLMALIEAHGALVTKDELLNRVWPGVIVEENNLHVQISALRKALDRDRRLIITVSGRGYRFAAPVTQAAPAPTAAAPPIAAALPGNLPTPISPLVGRDTELQELGELAAGRRR